MKINAEFDSAVAIHTGSLEWTASPMAGVKRRMLDRIGGEVARATSLVRYAPGSHFSAHTHSGGEEFIVLEGTFQDEHGDYPAGSYVRNPIGTKHIPRSEEGCTIFVKLWQFDPSDTTQFALDLNALELAPVEGLAGVQQAALHDVATETVVLEAWEPGIQRPFSSAGGAEILILDGSIGFHGDEFGVHDWIRLPPDSELCLSSGPSGAKLWIKTGHLRQIIREGWGGPGPD
ncbi:cupin domain-containing protein [Altererythrobacter sp. GH1-8]|uniref:cupin domain-containing protein n=1 Tax=Altererythrobacter sp. GH1-8 TaxID=3349333 RepID=UPI00374CE712